MQDLIQSSHQMSTLEISEITGKLHTNVMRDVRNMMAELGEIKNELSVLPATYISEQGKLVPMYNLDKRAVQLLVTGYSVSLRLKVLDRLDELEKKQIEVSVPVITLPQTYTEALRALLESVEAKEEMQKKLEAQAPKVEFYDQVTQSDDEWDMSSVAKVLNLGMGRNTIFRRLREKGVLRHNNEPMQVYVNSGYFRMATTTWTAPNGEQHVYPKTVVTQKGVDFIRKQIKVV
jgi:anti-repressor protein